MSDSRGPVAGVVHRIGWPALALAAVQVIVLALAWPVFVGLEPPRPELLLIVVLVVPTLAGLVDGALVLYGGRTPTVRGRLMLGGLRDDGAGWRMLVLVAALGIGDLAGWLRVAPGRIEAALDLAPASALLIAVLFGLVGYLAAFVVLLLVILPVGFLVASFLPPGHDEPVNVFGVLSVGELRGGAMTLLGVAWLFPGLILATTGIVEKEEARLWLLTCGVAVLVIVLGVVVNNLAVRKRNRAGVVTVFDQGLRGLRRRRR
jgi:hypothetical protein